MSEANGTHRGINEVVSVYNERLRLYESALTSRAHWAGLLGKAFGGKRDYYETLGYDYYLTAEKYHARYERQDIASRIVSAYPDETWRLEPCVYEDETKNDTAFEEAWKTLVKKLRVFHHMHRADILACLGRFSVLFLGFNDVSNIAGLEQPVSRRGARVINYLSSYGERHVEIVELDSNILSPRFGLPLIYEIDFDRAGSGARDVKRTQTSVGKKRVHWERLIHIADDVVEDDIYGIPKLRPVYNLLDDLLKVVGGGGETFWRNARKDLIVEVNSDARLSESDLTAIREKTEEYVHDLNRVLGLEGATTKALPVEVASPEGHFNIIMQLISGTTGIPARILLGSERGELASSQDAVNWAQQVMTRQASYAEPMVLRAFIDRLISTGVLVTPKKNADGYSVEWEPLLTENESEKAARAVQWTNAISTYANGAASAFVPVAEYREQFLGLDPESPYEMEEIAESRESEGDDEVEEDADAGAEDEAEDEETEDAES
jgi:uncharacterized protein